MEIKVTFTQISIWKIV